MSIPSTSSITIQKSLYEEILPLRKQFLQENNFQIRYDACHSRGWADSYKIFWNELFIAYASVKGNEDLADRDTLFEFYILPPYRKWTSIFFKHLLIKTQVKYIEAQSNDCLQSSMLYEFGKDIQSDVILFKDHHITQYQFPEIIFRPYQSGDDVFGKIQGDVGAYVLEKAGEIVADGGFLLHYNMPFADLYMEVKEDYHNQGLGSFILQEIKKECYQAGRVPAARCHISNKASRAALPKAGMQKCGFMLLTEVKL